MSRCRSRGETALARGAIPGGQAAASRMRSSRSKWCGSPIRRRRRPTALRSEIQRQLLALTSTAASGRSLEPATGSPRPMKCPKCGYLGFERVDRCRNCGYDFSMTDGLDASGAANPLGHRAARPARRSLAPRRRARRTVHAAEDAGADLDRVFGRRAAVSRPRRRLCRSSAADSRRRAAHHEGVATASAARGPSLDARSATRARRAAADAVARPGARQRLRLGRRSVPVAILRAAGGWRRLDVSRRRAAEDAPVGARFVAVAIDLLILAAHRRGRRLFHDADLRRRLRRARHPAASGRCCAFLFAQNVGYLVAFTAGGQTLGKMAVGIKVVPRSVAARRSISAARCSARRCGSCWPRRPVSVS